MFIRYDFTEKALKIFTFVSFLKVYPKKYFLIIVIFPLKFKWIENILNLSNLLSLNTNNK